jgi:hypothetical protein
MQARFKIMSGYFNPRSSRIHSANAVRSSKSDSGFLAKPAWLSAILADYRRATKAAERYESLRRRHPDVHARAGIGRSGVSRLIFDEYFRD